MLRLTKPGRQHHLCFARCVKDSAALSIPSEWQSEGQSCGMQTSEDKLWRLPVENHPAESCTRAVVSRILAQSCLVCWCHEAQTPYFRCHRPERSERNSSQPGCASTQQSCPVVMPEQLWSTPGMHVIHLSQHTHTQKKKHRFVSRSISEYVAKIPPTLQDKPMSKAHKCPRALLAPWGSRCCRKGWQRTWRCTKAK